jgi:hypothetical protein
MKIAYEAALFLTLSDPYREHVGGYYRNRKVLLSSDHTLHYRRLIRYRGQIRHV